MASGPITSWEIDGETVETVADFIFGGSKITADGDCSHEIKRRFLLGRKVMTNLDSIFKSRDTTLPTKVRLVKAMVFPVVTYGCESWTVKKAERRRIDAFELWCWRRLLRVPWTARRSNQSILKEISAGCSLEGLMLKLNSNTLATSCGELTHWKRLWCWEGLGAGGEGDNRGWDGWMASRTWVWVNSGSWWWTGRPGVLWFMGSQKVGHNWATELNCNFAWINWAIFFFFENWVVVVLLTKVHIVKVMIFPIVMYGGESWTIKKGVCWRTDAFELWCWRKLLKIPWTARRSNQLMLKEVNPDYSSEGMMLKLKL